MRKALTNILVYGVAVAILVLFCTRHDRIGFALVGAALIPAYLVFARAGRKMYDD